MSPLRSLLATAAWVVPALFLVYTGLSKLIAPDGTAPQSLAALLETASWSTWLRAVGAVELSVGVLLLVPYTRRAGALAAFGLVAGLSILVALNAHDEGFVSHCGCMGALPNVARGVGQAELLLVRNALLLFVIALGAYLRGDALTLGGAAARAGTAAAFVLLATLYTGERSKLEDARDSRAAADQSALRGSVLGWRLPPLPLRLADGTATTLNAWARPGDTLLVVSTRCPYCAVLAEHLSDLNGRIVADGGRLGVLVIEDENTRADTWMRAPGYEGLPYARLGSYRDAARIGVVGVPSWLAIDRDSRVLAHDTHGGPVSLLDALATSEVLLPAVGQAVWASLATRLAGPTAKLTDLHRDGFGGWIGVLAGPDGTLGRFVCRSMGSPRALALEVALGFDPEGHILGALPLARGSLVPLLAPGIAGELETLRGLTLDEALQACEKQLFGRSLSAPVWRSVRLVLERVRLTLPTAAPPGR